jgi:hypothetical protein
MKEVPPLEKRRSHARGPSFGQFAMTMGQDTAIDQSMTRIVSCFLHERATGTEPGALHPEHGPN